MQRYHMAMAVQDNPPDGPISHGLLSTGARPVLCHRTNADWADERGVAIIVREGDMFFPVASEESVVIAMAPE